MQKELNNLILKNKIKEAFQLYMKGINQRKYIFLPADLKKYYFNWIITGSVEPEAYIF